MESHRLLLLVMVVVAIVAALFLSKPSITGFVPTETHVQSLNIDADESQRFILRPTDQKTLKLSALSLSGSVSGTGLVNIYLSDGTNKWLIFSNKRKQGSSMEQITGLAVQELEIEPGQRLDTIESLPDGYSTEAGVFNNQCVETCILDEGMFNKPQLYLDVVIEPGTRLHVSSIRFTSE